MQGSKLAVFVMVALLAARFTASVVQASSSASRTQLKSLYFTQGDDSWVLLSTSDNSSAVVRISLALSPDRDTGRLLYVVEKDVPPEQAAIIGVQFDALFRPELLLSAPREGIYKSITLDAIPPSNDWYDFHLFYNFTNDSIGNVSFSVDGSPPHKTVSAEGVSHLLRGGGNFYLGGLPSVYLQEPLISDPAWLRYQIIAMAYSFEGCMYPPEIQYSSGYSETPGVMEGQHWLTNACGDVGNECSPLDAGVCGAGVCVEDYDGIWKCDCRETEQTGKDCALRAAIVPFYGNQGFIIGHIAVAPLNFDISLYFKSALSSGMIVYLVDLSNRSKVALYIEEGRLVLEVLLKANRSEVEHTISPDWPVDTETWYFVHVTSDGNSVKLQLGRQVISRTVALPEGLFLYHSEVTLGDTDTASAPQAFKGCMSNIHFGVQRPADVSIIAEDYCPDIVDPVPPSSPPTTPPNDLLHLIETSLGHKVELSVVYNKVNITFSWYSFGSSGTIALGQYYDNTAFNLSMSNGQPILQWRTLLGESLDLYVAGIDVASWCTITVLKNESHFGLVVEQWDQVSTSFDAIQGLALMEFDSILFGGIKQSASGLIHDIRVDGYNPTAWMTVHVVDDTVVSPTPQSSISSVISAAVTATHSSSSSVRTSVADGDSTKGEGTATSTVSSLVHQTSSPTRTGSPAPTGVVDTPPSSLVDPRTVDATMLAATIFVAVLVVLTIVVVTTILLISIFMFHCRRPCGLGSTKVELCESEEGFGKTTPPLKRY